MSTAAPLQYDFASLKNATAIFCSGLLVANKYEILHDLLSPDCNFASNKETRRGSAQCMESLIDIQNVILKFELENCSLRRGLKINDKEEKSRLLLMPINGTMPFRLGFILHWECGILIHISVVEDPWQGFLDDLSSSEENRKLNQRSTNSLKKSVSASHHSWRRISDVVVDAYLASGEGECECEDKGASEGGGEDKPSEHVVVRLWQESKTSLLETPVESRSLSETISNSVNTEDIIHKTTTAATDEKLNSEEQSTSNIKSAEEHCTHISSDENIFSSASFLDDIEIDMDSMVAKEEVHADEKKRIRFDTTVNALLIAERCELVSDDLFYSPKDLKSYQIDLNDELSVIQKEHGVNFEVAMKIYFCDSPEEIEAIKLKSKAEGKTPQPRISLSRINSINSSEDQNHRWYRNLPLARLVRAYKRSQKKKADADTSAPQSLPDSRSGSSNSLASLEDIEGRITEIRASSFGSSLRGRDPEATKFVITVKVLCCVNLRSRNPSFNKLRAMNISVKVKIGKEVFETPVVSGSNPVFSNASSFLFSVSLEEAMHGSIEFTIFSTATKKNVVGASRIPFVAVKTRYDCTTPSRIIIPITTNEPDFKSIGKGFYCKSRDDDDDDDHACETAAGAAVAAGGVGTEETEETGREGVLDEEVDEEKAFLKHMYKINRLSTSSLNYDVDKLPKLYVEVTKVDVCGQD